ncbi:hypothetical protein VTJ04DRAFT_10460 [Mycothermus thermophilus]|uniref:uncharacterized protein n=1 Tax=Humicola insolens TaxID=85995 RepID=UPI00374440D1
MDPFPFLPRDAPPADPVTSRDAAAAARFVSPFRPPSSFHVFVHFLSLIPFPSLLLPIAKTLQLPVFASPSFLRRAFIGRLPLELSP